MLATLIAVLVTSLMGSTHCVGMCGPFVLLASRRDDKLNSRLLLFYHLGRLYSYALLGAMAGSLGYGVLGLGELAGVSGEIIKYSGLFLVVYGSWLVWSQLFHQQINLWWAPKIWQKIIHAGYRSTRYYPATMKSLMIGFYSGFLPCGWLYAFVMLAIGTHNMVFGAGILVAFWLGTVPALTGFSLGIKHLGTWFKSRTQMMSAGICIMFGMMMVYGERDACCQSKEAGMVLPLSLTLKHQEPSIIPQQIKRPCCQP